MIVLKAKTYVPKKPNGQAVLLLHGWAGMPESVEPLGEALAKAGYLVYSPLLSGHGCDDPEDFAKATMEDWIKESENAFLELRDRYENVHVAGISMGALLGLHLAKKFCCPSLLLQAPALSNKNKAILLSPLLRFFKYKKKKSPSKPEASKGEAADRLDREVYKAYTWFAPAYQLLRMQRLIRKYFKNGEFKKGPGSTVMDIFVQWAIDDHSININSPLEIVRHLSDNGLVGESVRHSLSFRVYPTGKHTLPLYSKESTKEAVDFLKSLF